MPAPIHPKTDSSPGAPGSARALGAWKCCLVLAALTTALKLCLLLFPSEHVSPKWVTAEELHRGNIASEILRGPLLAVQDYAFAPNHGGSVVEGVLAVPFVALFGNSIASVRLVPILFNALAVVLLFLVLDRNVSRRAAWIGGVLFACAPPGYSLLAMTAFGTHVENNALTMLVLLLYLELHRLGAARHEGGARETRLALGLGAAAGFALYFGYSFAVALVAILVFEFLHDKLFFARRWFRFAALGFAIGFAPWIAYNLAHGFAGLTIYDAPLTTRVSLANVIENGWWRAQLLFTDQIPGSLYFRGFAGRDRLGERAGDLVGAAILFVLVAFAAWRSRAMLARAARAVASLRFRPVDLGAPVCFLVYVPLFVLAFAGTNLAFAHIAPGGSSPTEAPAIAHEGRYVAPLFPFLCLLAGFALGELGHAFSHGRSIATWATSAFAAACVAGTLAVCDVGRAGESLRRPGSSDAELARWMAWTWRTDVRRLDRIVTGLETRRSAEVADGMIFALAQGLKWGITTQNSADSKARETTRKNLAALRFLHDRVADAYKPYCEPPIPGEKIYSGRERAEFWRNYRFRERAQRVRDPMALVTPSL